MPVQVVKLLGGLQVGVEQNVLRLQLGPVEPLVKVVAHQRHPRCGQTTVLNDHAQKYAPLRLQSIMDPSTVSYCALTRLSSIVTRDGSGFSYLTVPCITR